jgi:integrin beta 3
LRAYLGELVINATRHLLVSDQRFNGFIGFMPKDGKDGKDFEPEAVRYIIEEAVAALPPPADGKDGRDGKDGKDGRDAKDVDEEALIMRIAHLIPLPEDGKDGKDFKVEEVRPILEELVRAIPPSPPGPPGKDAEPLDPQQFVPAIQETIRHMVAAMPMPQDGKDGKDGKDFIPDLEEVRPMVSQAVLEEVAKIPTPANGKDGRDGRDGKDGVGLAGFFIDREGSAIATLSDGTTHNLGCILGKDGLPGLPGKDGRDLSLVNLRFELDERVFRVKHEDGNVIFSTTIPVPLDRGSYSTIAQYEKSDEVTFAGQVYIALKDNPVGKPGETTDWRLRSRKGRDGRDGKDGARGERGPEGAPAQPPKPDFGRHPEA